jgi:shikimate kinase
MMGAGKSTIGPLLAGRLGLPFIDLDDVVSTDRTITEIWETEGEGGFRRREAEALRREASGRAAVIAAGGGAVLDDRNVAAMRSTGLVIWLDVAPEILAERIDSADTPRPLLAGDDLTNRLFAIAAEREDTYLAAAHLVIASPDPGAILDTIEAVWNASS